jgi:hypothetical protein
MLFAHLKRTRRGSSGRAPRREHLALDAQQFGSLGLQGFPDRALRAAEVTLEDRPRGQSRIVKICSGPRDMSDRAVYGRSNGPNAVACESMDSLRVRLIVLPNLT